MARDAGLHYVYEGNIYGDGAHTTCTSCGSMLIRRFWHDVTENRLKQGRCPVCATAIPGVWEKDAGNPTRSTYTLHEKYIHLNLYMLVPSRYGLSILRPSFSSFSTMSCRESGE